MEAGALILSQKLGQQVGNYIWVKCCEFPDNPWSYLILYHFEGRRITEYGNYPGFWCYHNPFYEEQFLYFSETADFSKTRVPGPVERMANLLEYDLYVALDVEDGGDLYRCGTAYGIRRFQRPLLDDADKPDFLL